MRSKNSFISELYFPRLLCLFGEFQHCFKGESRYPDSTSTKSCLMLNGPQWGLLMISINNCDCSKTVKHDERWFYANFWSETTLLSWKSLWNIKTKYNISSWLVKQTLTVIKLDFITFFWWLHNLEYCSAI